MMTSPKNTLIVAMVTYDGVINLNLIKENVKDNPSVLMVGQSTMNKNDKILSCVLLKLALSDGSAATIHLYAPRIRIVAKRNIPDIVEDIKKLLGPDIKYVINQKKVEIMITLYSFGGLGDVFDIERYLLDSLVETYDGIKSSESYMTRVHVKGTRSDSHLKEISSLIENMFDNSKYSSHFKVNNSYYCLVNSGYSLNKNIAIYELALHIKQAPGFQNAFCIYDNIQNSHMVIIILPLELSEEEIDKLWRKDIETTYTIRNTGIVTQSCPSIELGNISHRLLINAIEYLGKLVIRE